MGVQAFLHDPLVVHAAGVTMSVIFSVSAWAKLRDIALFRLALENYRLLGRAVGPFAWAFASTEMAAGVALLFAASRSLGAWVGLVVMTMATGAVALSLLRGIDNIECGCGSGGQRISWGLVVRNLFLCAALVLATSSMSPRALEGGDYLSVMGAVLALLTLYASANQLLANQPRLKELQS